jgi:proteasome accessory factor B
MNLTICLLVARNYITKDRIRQTIEAYHDMGDDAFDRMFDRDKEELRVLGIPIELGSVQKGFEDEVGYRISRAKFELPEVSLEADEAAIVGLAARVWQHARLASATSQGLRKLRASGVDVDEAALSILEPQLATNEPAFDSVFAAVTERRSMQFDYRTPTSSRSSTRQLEPWGIVSWHGHWYVVGHDVDRDAPRMFRVSRIQGEARLVGSPGGFQPPNDLDLRAQAQALAPAHPHSTATVHVRHGAGGALRRRSETVTQVDAGWTEIEVPYGSGSSLADELVSLGPDVVAVAPSDIREAVVRRLTAVSGSHS